MNMISKFFRIISKLGYKSLINTQIKVYNKLKKQYPKASENDLLNLLIISRTATPVRLPGVSFSEEQAHYKPILDNPNKTLEDVIWAVANYEYFESEYAQSRNQKYKIPDQFLNEMKQKIQDYIRKAVEESIRQSIEFRNFKRGYKNFLWIFFIEILFVILLTTLFQNSNLLLRPPISFSLNLLASLFGLVLLFYTIRIVIDAFKVFKTIKPSKLQIGFLYFLLCLFLFINFFSPLIIGMYVIHLMNKYKQINKS